MVLKIFFVSISYSDEEDKEEDLVEGEGVPEAAVGSVDEACSSAPTCSSAIKIKPLHE